jgi:arylsulfatase A-like enzyme
MKNISRREFARVGGLALGALATASTLKAQQYKAQPPGKKQPNVIFFMTDDQRWDGLSIGGNRYFQTPNMDRIGHEGANFTNCFNTNSLCGPSRATCLTGKYSHNNGVRVNEGTFPLSERTWLEETKKYGYTNAFVGKWHNKNFGRDRDFDYYFGFRGQGQYIDPLIQENDGPEKQYKGWVEDILADHTLDFIRKAHTDGKPFAMCHWFKTPHQHCIPAERHKDLYSDIDFPKPPTFDTDYEGKPKAVAEADMKIGGQGETSYVQDWNKFMRDYHRVLKGVDENVGRVLDLLDELGIADDTVVIFTSDNGYFLGEFGFFDKRLMYEPSLRIPLVVRYPRMIKPGTEIDEFALNIDFAPTLMEYMGMPVPKAVDGRSLLPLLGGGHVPDWREDFLYEYYAYPDWHYVKPNKGVRNNRWKYIHFYDFPKHEYELYDLQNDPLEEHNLYGKPEYEETAKYMAERLRQLRVEAGDPDLQFE